MFTHIELVGAVFIEVWQRLRVKFGGGRVYRVNLAEAVFIQV